MKSNKNLKLMGVRVAPDVLEQIDELAKDRTENNPYGAKVTKSDLMRKWIIEGLNDEIKKNSISEVPA